MRRRGRGRRRPRVCQFCSAGVGFIDYKEPEKLEGFMTDHGKILPRRKTGTCAKHQRGLSTAIKRARHLALIPYHIR